jgi:transcriptional regulator with XRE-family HTH domain
MSVDNLTIYEEWNIHQPKILPRSRLFSLEPIGIGTPQVESLTSYLIRLAELHCLSLPILISRLISPYLQTTFPKQWSSRSLGALFQKARALQSHGDLAKDFVQALEALTLRKDLSFLTLSVWSNVLSHKGLLRNHKAWCPFCYQQGWQSNHLLYEPLLWSIEAVKVCPRHHINLVENCPHCGSQLPLLTWKSSLGCCSKCRQLLFSTTEILSNNLPPSSLSQGDFQTNIALSQSIAKLIEIMPTLFSSPTQDLILNNISMTIDVVTQGNITAFAKQLNLPKNTVWGWYHRQSFPPIASLLKIAQCLDLPLLTFLIKKIDSIELDTISARQLSKTQSPLRKSPRHLDFNLLRQQLLDVLELPDEESPSFKEVSETLGYNRRVLSRHFPDLCQAISAKYRRSAKAIYYQTLNKCCEEIRTVTYSLYSEGKYPTEALVANRLSHPSFFRYQQVRDVFKQAKQDLGFKS